MFHIELFLTLLFIDDFAICEHNKDFDLGDFSKDLPTTADGIKKICESNTTAYVDYFHNKNFCYTNMDSKSCCYCSTYFKNYFIGKNFQPDLKTFHLATTQCPLIYPIRRNLNYYRLKKIFLENSSSLFPEDNYTTEMCSQNKKITNSTRNIFSRVTMFCDLYQFYEFEKTHIYHVEYLQLIHVTLPNVTFEAINLFEQNSWTAFLNKK